MPAKKVAVKKKVMKAKPSGAAVGQMVPKFALASTGGKTVRSEMLRGSPVVLYFYPRDATPGCTLEGQDFSRLNPRFKELGAAVFGISRDTIPSHEKFRAKESYTHDLLSDQDEAVCQLFGVIKMKNMYGKKVRGIERSTFVIDRDGRLVKEWRGVKVPGHAQEVLTYVQSL